MAASASPSAAAVVDLAALFPKQLGGYPLDTKVITPADAVTFFDGALKVIATNFLKVDVSTLKVVTSFGGASRGEMLITAVQVPGADTAALEQAFATGVDPMSIAGGFKGKPATVSGKSVVALGSPPYQYVRVVGDVVWIVSTRDAAVATEAFAALP